MDEKKDIPIHYKTIDLGPHQRKVIVLPKNPNPPHYHTWIWVLFTALIGLSSSSFLLNIGENSLSKINGKNNSVLASNGTSENSVSQIPEEKIQERRLGSDDADFATTTPKDGEYYFLKDNYTLPRTSALSYLAGDITTGDIIISKNPEMVLPIASVSKLITALVSKDVLDQHEPIKVSRSSVNTYGTMGGLYAGEKILLTDLLYPLLMESSNDGAEVIAEAYGRSAFLQKMREKVASLEMKDTAFGDPSGLSAENVSTANDLFKLAEYIQINHPEIWDITRVRGYSILGHSWTNSNTLSRRTSFLGGKNGYTDEAGRTTVSVFELNIENQKRKIAIVVLKSNDRNADADTIIRFLEKNVGFLPAGE